MKAMEKCDIALYGLGVMGSSLAKNIIRHGFLAAVYSKSEKERKQFQIPGDEERYVVCEDEGEMVKSLKDPGIIFLMITAGPAVDDVIESLLPYLKKKDVLIDGGNSHFRDTQRRWERLKKEGIYYLGAGVSGGELGALYGPSMMAGGSREGWEAGKKILKAVAARYGEEACCAYVGGQGAGHYVKMVHNGIEYAILQLIAETYHIMKYGMGLGHERITEIFCSFKGSKLDSYLLEISVSVLKRMDEDGSPLVEKILDVAEQKGTGRWTLEDAIERGVYIPTIFEAVSARTVSSDKTLRVKGSGRLPASGISAFSRESLLPEGNWEEKLRDALLAGMIICYDQGLKLIRRASEEEGWQIQLEKLVSIWRAGCIIRSRLLTEVQKALAEKKENLLFTDTFSYIGELEPALREVTAGAAKAAVAVPGLASALHYYDYLRMEQMPVNFVQALRDCFGAHTYQRTDRGGHFHTDWQQESGT